MKRISAILAIALLAPAAAGAKPKLHRFRSCPALIAYGQQHRPDYKPGGPPPEYQPATPPPTTGEATAPEAAAGDSGSGDFSLTNNQEAGVFEPDIVKTDGRYVYAVTSNNVLEIVDVATTPKLVGELPLPQGYNAQLLLYHGKLLVAEGTPNGTLLARVDVGDPAHPVLERTLTVNGDLVDERRTKGTVRVVISVRPRAIEEPDSPATGRRAWLPRATLRNVRRKTHRRQTLVGCGGIRYPGPFSGLEELTVLTLDLDKGLDPVDSDAVMSGSGIVYSSEQNLFVATQRYQPELEAATDGPVPPSQTTQIHRFSLDDADNTTYRGSGNVRGFVLNQFALSEQDGVLRVASTDIPPWFEGNEQSSTSSVTTLTETATGFKPLGQVSGIGDGERIFAVRFLGDAAYVVTFKQVDPLFTVDLSDPAHPAVKGQLELPGVSAYLHPIAGDRLIGVGTGPNSDGNGSGLQLSEFDVSDLSHPKLLQRKTIDNGSSEVSYDHHAFLWWAPRDLAVLPVSVQRQYTCNPTPGYACPAIAYAPDPATADAFIVQPGGIQSAGTVSHDSYSVRRSMVLGNRLITMSDGGIGANNLATFSGDGFAAFSGGAGSATPPSP